MKVLTLVCLLFVFANGQAQKRIFTKNGTISFSAGTSVEDIDGVNKSVTSVVDITTGQIEFAALMKGFEFKRALMQEHFNENYVESEKYPKAVFKGQIIDVASVKFTQDGSYPVKVKGQLDMHGVKKDVEVNATFVVKGGAISGEAEFSILMADYNIAIPGAVADKISPTVKIHTLCAYKPL